IIKRAVIRTLASGSRIVRTMPNGVDIEAVGLFDPGEIETLAPPGRHGAAQLNQRVRAAVRAGEYVPGVDDEPRPYENSRRLVRRWKQGLLCNRHPTQHTKRKAAAQHGRCNPPCLLHCPSPFVVLTDATELKAEHVRFHLRTLYAVTGCLLKGLQGDR